MCFGMDSFSDIPDGPAIFLANEFFDALPIRQFEKGEKGWGERFVDIDPDGAGLRLCFAKRRSCNGFNVPDIKREGWDGACLKYPPYRRQLLMRWGNV